VRLLALTRLPRSATSCRCLPQFPCAAVVECADRQPEEYSGYEIALFDRVRDQLGWPSDRLNWTCMDWCVCLACVWWRLEEISGVAGRAALVTGVGRRGVEWTREGRCLVSYPQCVAPNSTKSAAGGPVTCLSLCTHSLPPVQVHNAGPYGGWGWCM